MSFELSLREPTLRHCGASASFSDPASFDRLDQTDAKAFDELEFGAIAVRRNGIVERFNALEMRRSGLRAADVVGKNFFSEVAPCTNNSVIGGRLLHDEILDTELDYIFTYRLIPTKVRLRLLKRPSSALMYLLVRMSGG